LKPRPNRPSNSRDVPTENPDDNFAEIGPGLKKIRRRRWCLWAVILIYLPAMWVTLRLSSSMHAVGVVFGVWFVLLFTAAVVVAVARCPRCGNYFHMHGMTFLCLRKCLHCQLHLKADKKASD
jgi:hypothetical protein